MVKLKNLSDRTFVIKGEVTLAPKGTVEIEQADAEYLVGLYEGELEILGAAPAAPKAPAEMTTSELRKTLKALGKEVPKEATQEELVALLEEAVTTPAV